MQVLRKNCHRICNKVTNKDVLVKIEVIKNSWIYMQLKLKTSNAEQFFISAIAIFIQRIFIYIKYDNLS